VTSTFGAAVANGGSRALDGVSGVEARVNGAHAWRAATGAAALVGAAVKLLCRNGKSAFADNE
jgi:hypothetical protein